MPKLAISSFIVATTLITGSKEDPKSAPSIIFTSGLVMALLALVTTLSTKLVKVPSPSVL